MEKRVVKQIEKRDENGNLEYTIIPNYKTHVDFMTKAELKFYRFLINIIIELKKTYDLNLSIFAQVAVNRIIDVNNDRVKNELFDKISRKSIDFVLFDEKNSQIYCCIELDDKTHENSDRHERDILLDNVFKNNVKLIHITQQEYYSKEEIIKKIIND